MSSDSTPDLQVIKPSMSAGSARIEAFFSLKNASLENETGRIPGLNLGFNTADSEEVIEHNRELLYEQLNLDADWIARGGQVHSTRVQVVTSGGLYPETDGLITRIPGLALGIQVADCAAVLLADEKHGVIGAFHAGWRGASGGIVDNAVATMLEEGAEAEEISVYISPCISEYHFEVGEEVAECFPAENVDRTSYEKPHVDLKGYLVEALSSHGIKQEHIEVDPGCTYAESDRFYSYRREGEQSGRMFGFIKIKESG